MSKIATTLLVAALAITSIAGTAQAQKYDRQSKVPGAEEPLTYVPKPTRNAYEQCLDVLGPLRTFDKASILAAGGKTVQLRPLCERDFAVDPRQTATLFTSGNVDGLRATIWKNPQLAAALAAAQYTQDDIIGIDIRSQMVVIMVHRRTL